MKCWSAWPPPVGGDGVQGPVEPLLTVIVWESGESQGTALLLFLLLVIL